MNLPEIQAFGALATAVKSGRWTALPEDEQRAFWHDAIETCDAVVAAVAGQPYDADDALLANRAELMKQYAERELDR